MVIIVYGTNVWVSDGTKDKLEKARSEITRMRAQDPGVELVVTPTLDQVIEQALDALEERLNEATLEKG